MFDALAPVFEYVSPFVFTLALLNLILVLSILCNVRDLVPLYHGTIVFVIKPGNGGSSLILLISSWTLLCLELILVATAGYIVGDWTWLFWGSLLIIPGWWLGLIGVAYIWALFFSPDDFDEPVDAAQQRAERKAMLNNLRLRLGR